MLLYRYRIPFCLSVLFVLTLSGYLFDLRGLQTDYFELQTQAQDLQRVLLNQQTNSVTHSAVGSELAAKSSLLREFLQLLAASRVNLLTINKIPAQQNEVAGADCYQIILSANYGSLVTLLQTLSVHSSKYLMQKLSIKAAENSSLRIELILRVSVMPGKKAKVMTTRLSMQSPFCATAATAMQRQVLDDQLHHYELSELKWLGTVTVSSQMAAIILFPNGITNEITKNSEIGKERAIVMDISPQTLTLRLQNQKQFQFHLG